MPSLARRRLPAAIILLVAVVAAVIVWRLLPREDRAKFVHTTDQNVLIITIDTLRGDTLSTYGGPARAPHLDALAAAGIRFTFAHAHAVVTLPSHASILTGRYPFEHGVRDNAGFRLEPAAVTLAEAAREKGFATGAFVGAFPLDRQFGLAQGFDVYDDLGGREIAPADFAFAERPAGEVVAAARRWIEQQQTRWLAWVHVFDPHAPYAPPAPFDSEYAGNAYAGEVAYVDHALGPLLDLARLGPRPTTVVVTADHGEGLGDHGEATHGVFAYESTLRVPLILAQVGPGTRGSARPATSDVPVRHVDIVPTIADLTGITAGTNMPGRTLLAADHEERDARPTYFEAMTAMLKRGWAPLQGTIVGREKYISLPIEELYDLAADSREQTNLAPAAGARKREMAERLRAFAATLPGEQGTETPEVRARLQALGYLSGSAARKSRYGEADDPKRLIDVDRLMMDGIELHRAGRSAAAQDAYRRVIERRPDMGLAYQRLAFIQWESGATTEAIATLRRALETNGPNLDIEVRLGTYLAETGASAEALAILERAVAARPAEATALNALGIAYARGGRAADAVRAFERILATDPRDAFALENLGAVHLERGDLRAAGDAFRRAAANDPRSSRARAGLGVVALRTGRRDEAITHWQQAVALDAANFDALYNLGTELVNAGRPADARPHLEQFVRTAPRAFYARDIERVRQFLGSQGTRR
jgi:arylsulfatase A-like enzyme/Flp pilus assembly protein TadD